LPQEIAQWQKSQHQTRHCDFPIRLLLPPTDLLLFNLLLILRLSTCLRGLQNCEGCRHEAIKGLLHISAVQFFQKHMLRSKFDVFFVFFILTYFIFYATVSYPFSTTFGMSLRTTFVLLFEKQIQFLSQISVQSKHAIKNLVSYLDSAWYTYISSLATPRLCHLFWFTQHICPRSSHTRFR
jgi:hypothetical protein